jgi:hypothetical protein
VHKREMIKFSSHNRVTDASNPLISQKVNRIYVIPLCEELPNLILID